MYTHPQENSSAERPLIAVWNVFEGAAQGPGLKAFALDNTCS
jgi:hypothetical protein